ncbi:Alpha/Beta hydrolase protein [Xylariaceae sp. FL0255]|nr:Alpha/Beta hydrolase protein [Xylariaceae sp. FL0255]
MTAISKQIISVPHLDGIKVGCTLLPQDIDSFKPTLVLFNPFTTTADYYQREFEDKELQAAVNLLAIEPLGHGRTQAETAESFNYWDSAIMSIQVLQCLGVEKAFALGTSQGGWIAMRMALLAPKLASSLQILGVIPIGSCMDGETPRARELGCWDGVANTSGLTKLGGDFTPANGFEPGSDYHKFLMEIGYGPTIDSKTNDFWAKALKENYNGDEGKRRICMAAVALACHDSLHLRLPYVRCPVLFLHGTADIVFGIANAEEEIKLLKNSPSAKLVRCEGGVHFLSWTHPETVQRELMQFIRASQEGGFKAGL